MIFLFCNKILFSWYDKLSCVHFPLDSLKRWQVPQENVFLFIHKNPVEHNFQPIYLKEAKGM